MVEPTPPHVPADIGTAASLPAAPLAAAPGHHAPKYNFIDALRGYAVLLVITCHTGNVFPNLPYPLKKITEFGWHGVQLFFLMSCVTLLLSWQSDASRGRTDVVAFWMRRFFRIAPLYYLAAVVYFVIEPPPGRFDPGQLLASLAFVNAWHPLLVPTTADRWMVVPGGWSIGVEATFYALFPLIVVTARSLGRAIAFAALALLAGGIVNPLAEAAFTPLYGQAATAHFLYFWFPNQLCVFALGAVLFHLLQRAWAEPHRGATRLLRRHATAVILACAAACVLAANLHLPERLSFVAPLPPPTFIVATLIFMVFALTLGVAPACVFNAAPLRSLGKVSFSAYLVHFAVLQVLPALLPHVFDRQATGWLSIRACVALWLAAVPLTYAISMVTFRMIEQPMIGVGRALILRRRGRRAVTAAAA